MLLHFVNMGGRKVDGEYMVVKSALCLNQKRNYFFNFTNRTTFYTVVFYFKICDCHFLDKMIPFTQNISSPCLSFWAEHLWLYHYMYCFTQVYIHIVSFYLYVCVGVGLDTAHLLQAQPVHSDKRYISVFDVSSLFSEPI